METSWEKKHALGGGNGKLYCSKGEKEKMFLRENRDLFPRKEKGKAMLAIK